ncbi:MAG: hypothetical protein AAGB15_06325 [Pseudomonadota bacterium]
MTKRIAKAALPALAILTIAAAPLSTATAAGSQQEAAAQNFAEADVNADGALTMAEFTALIDLNAADGIGRAAMIKRMGKQAMAFGRIDANSDGVITTEEISAMAARAQR